MSSIKSGLVFCGYQLYLCQVDVVNLIWIYAVGVVIGFEVHLTVMWFMSIIIISWITISKSYIQFLFGQSDLKPI